MFNRFFKKKFPVIIFAVLLTVFFCIKIQRLNAGYLKNMKEEQTSKFVVEDSNDVSASGTRGIRSARSGRKIKTGGVIKKAGSAQ